MSKNVLILGGSYFAGRVFAMVASREADFSLTFVNRGRYSMSHLPNVTEYRCDRHDAAALRALPAADYDAVVDFCGYQPGDIQTVLENLPGNFGRYIYLSTVDAYDKEAASGIPDETAPLLSLSPRVGADDIYLYRYGKRFLEAELETACGLRGVDYTVLRPSFIYGPYNYAPRESYYVQKIVAGEAIPVPTDARAKFQFVYVKDVANAIIACVNSPKAANQSYNLSAPEELDYPGFMEVLTQVSDLPVRTENVTVEQVLQQNIPLPFPLTAAESELYNGEKIVRELDFHYTPFRDGMEKTYQAFKGVYMPR